MINTAIKRLEHLCNIVPALLSAIDESVFSSRPAPGHWSKKEIIGHLIDSAANNHQRFVRAQFETVPTIVYDQNKWNEWSFYQQIASSQIIAFWTVYNKQLVELIRRIPEDKLRRECNTGGDTPFTLEFLINDYVEHMEHHLRQVVAY